MKNLNEILLAIVVLITLFLKVDPFHWLMPTAAQMFLLCLFSAAVALYAGVIFREKPHDERESHHLAAASRAGYLAGVGALSILLVVQDLLHELDPWLVGVLALMILVKLAVLKLLQIQH
ncbi:MAG: hypothetical protein HKM06_09655 [Spirochaetales bacterium]|nr:hypothetical protein [Spirochaetales bacterium]